MSGLLKCNECESQQFTLHKNGPHIQAKCGNGHPYGVWIKHQEKKVFKGQDDSICFFGKHKGTPWADVEEDYLKWCVENMSFEPGVMACKRELERRKNPEAAAAAVCGDPADLPPLTKSQIADDIPF